MSVYIEKFNYLNNKSSIYLIQRYILLYCFSVIRLNKNITKKKHLLYLLKSLKNLIELLLINSVNPNKAVVETIKNKNNLFLQSHTINLIQKYTKIPNTNKLKMRTNLSYSKRKLWKQKGTGRARVGSRKSPILRGGAKAFGPRGLIRKIKINKKLKKLLFISSIFLKINYFTIFEFLTPKNLPYLENHSILLLISNRNKEAFNMALEFKNYKNFTIKPIDRLNPLDVMKHQIIIISKDDLFELFNRFLF